MLVVCTEINNEVECTFDVQKANQNGRVKLKMGGVVYVTYIQQQSDYLASLLDSVFLPKRPSLDQCFSTDRSQPSNRSWEISNDP